DREAPIHYAAQKGSTTAVIMLLQAGVNVAVQTGLEQTALHIAAKEGHIKTVRYILENSAQNLNLNTRDYWQKTPLQWAAENGHEEILRLLIGAGYDIMA
ncbi:ankyrin, partial [Wilcoxina mikolae CBS 423.85]